MGAAGTRLQEDDPLYCLTQFQGLHRLARRIEADNPKGDLYIITYNLSSHSSLEACIWLVDHPRIITCSFPQLRAGSICRRTGGGSSAAMRLQARALPIPSRSSKPPVSPLLSSMLAQSSGFEDAT